MKSRSSKAVSVGEINRRREVPPRTFMLKTGAVFAALALLRFIAANFPADRLWGLSYYAYLPEWLVYAFSILGLLLASAVFFPLFRKTTLLMQGVKGKLSIVIAAVASAVVFWVFRMDTYFLGDGAVYLAEHFRLLHDLPVSKYVLYSLGSAPLTGYLLAVLAKLLWAVSGDAVSAFNPQAAWWVSGTVAGMLCVAVVIHGIRRFTSDGALRLAGLSMLLLAPGTLFFFGYVEYYTLLMVAGTAYFFAADRALRGEISLWIPIALLAVTVAMHFMALLLLPGCVLMLYLKYKKTNDVSMALRMYVVMVLASLLPGGVWYFVSGTAFEGSRVILSLSPFGEPGAVQEYTMLHSAHLLDIINMVFLVGAAFVAALPFLFSGRMSSESVLALTHVSYLGFLLFFGYTGFGMARDWDVNVLFGVALAIFVLTLLRLQTDALRRCWLSYLIFGAMFVGTLPWFIVNIDTQSSVARFRDIMALDDMLIPGDFALNGYEHLRKYYQSTADHHGVAWAIDKKIEMVGYPDDFRKYVLIAVTTMAGADREHAIQRALDGLALKLNRMVATGEQQLYEGSRQAFEEIYAETLMQAEYLALANVIRADIPQNYLDRLRIILPDGIGVILVEGLIREVRGQAPESVKNFIDAANAIESSATLAAYAGRVLLANGSYPEAVHILKKALELDDQFTLPCLYLAQAILSLDNPDRSAAAEQLRRFIASPDGHRIGDKNAQRQLIESAQEMLRQIEALQ